MSDIFISYAREDREIAERLAVVLAAEGWRVWWDFQLGAGDAFRETIEAELDAATAVIVLWSPHSVRSSFVRDEASRAHARGALVPVAVGDLDLADLPLGFGELHTQVLSGWKGDVRDASLARLIAGLRKRLSGTADDGEDGAAAGRAAAGDSRAGSRSGNSRPGRIRIRALDWTSRRTLALGLFLLTLPLFALGGLPVHRVEVMSPAADGPVSVAMAVVRGEDTTHVYAGPPQWRFYARPGRYVLSASPDGYRNLTRQFDVGWFTFGRRIVLADLLPLDTAADDRSRPDSVVVVGPDTLDHGEGDEGGGGDGGTGGDGGGPGPGPLRGTLDVRSTPPGIEVFLSGERLGVTPLTVTRPPGTYTIELRLRHVDDERFGYYARESVQVRAGAATGFGPTLPPIELPELLVLPRPDARGATFYLDSATSDGLLGQVAGASRAFRVFPGERRVLKKQGAVVTECGRVVLTAGTQQQITC